MSSKVKPLIFGVCTLLCLILTIVCRVVSDNEVVPFEEVKVTVASSETRQRRVSGNTYDYHYVTVRYEGETYELKNVYDSYSYRVGNTITAYLSNGTLYANEAGVQTSTPVAKAYFAFMIATFVLLIIFLSSLSGLSRKRK